MKMIRVQSKGQSLREIDMLEENVAFLRKAFALTTVSLNLGFLTRKEAQLENLTSTYV